MHNTNSLLAAATATATRMGLPQAAKQLGLPINVAYDLLWEAGARFSNSQGRQLVNRADVDALASIL